MQDEEMDNMDELIREASKNHHPVYDDKAWKGMEELLDRHLPVKSDRRRPFIVFLLMLFIAGSVFFMILYQPGHKKNITPVKNKPGDISLNGITAKNLPANAGVLPKAQKITRDLSTEFLPVRDEKYAGRNFKDLAPTKRFANNKGVDIKTAVAGIVSGIAGEQGIAIKNDRALPERDNQITRDNKPSMPLKLPLIDQAVLSGIQTGKNDSVGSVIKNERAGQAPGKSPAKPAGKKGFANNFAINLSAGPDLSFVGLGDGGKTNLNYGIGMGYTLANRFTVRAGFYVAKKIYTAKASDYHPPSWYWTYNSALERIDANCNIYEVPVSASYNFGRSKNHSWLAGLGVSTLFMKRETYNYLYKDAWGQSRNKSWTLRNGSRHYFSMLTISGGYQYRVNQHFSIIAEPYLKLPLQGIGFGKIKLNSGGLLFTASILPFTKRN